MTQAQFQSFYHSSNRQLWSYLFRMVADRDLASDLMQESYVRYLRERSRSVTDASQRSYLYSIATNLVRDSWRRGKIHGKWVEEAASDTADYSADQIPLRLDMASAMEKLPLQHRSLLWLAYVEGYTHEEIARMLEVQPTSVRVLLMRARRRMVEILRDMGIGKESLS